MGGAHVWRGIGHLDRNPDLELHRRLARAGAFLSYDQIPKPKYATETAAIGLIVALARDGLHRQVVVGGDFARRSCSAATAGSRGSRICPSSSRSGCATRPTGTVSTARRWPPTSCGTTRSGR
jgi:hypothetical protein